MGAAIVALHCDCRAPAAAAGAASLLHLVKLRRASIASECELKGYAPEGSAIANLFVPIGGGGAGCIDGGGAGDRVSLTSVWQALLALMDVIMNKLEMLIAVEQTAAQQAASIERHVKCVGRAAHHKSFSLSLCSFAPQHLDALPAAELRRRRCLERVVCSERRRQDDLVRALNDKLQHAQAAMTMMQTLHADALSALNKQIEDLEVNLDYAQREGKVHGRCRVRRACSRCASCAVPSHPVCGVMVRAAAVTWVRQTSERATCPCVWTR
jgi:hypothetical protein